LVSTLLLIKTHILFLKSLKVFCSFDDSNLRGRREGKDLKIRAGGRK